MRLTVSVALICLLCGCLCCGPNEVESSVKETATTLSSEGDGTPEGAPDFKYEVKVIEGRGDPVLSIINKDDFAWHTCYILINNEYSQIISEEYRADVTKDVPAGGSFDVVLNGSLRNQYDKTFSGKLTEFYLDCDQGTITEQVTTTLTTIKRKTIKG